MKSLDKLVLEIIETKHPKNVRELVQLVQKETNTSLEEIKIEVENLQQKGLIVLEEPTIPRERLDILLHPGKSLWFWVSICLTLLAFVSILLFPGTGTPFSYLRYAFGFLLAVFLPGYCLTETLFPRKDSLDEIERFTFSVGLSFALTALVGLLLSLTPFGLTLTTALLALGSIVIVLALVALNRKYKAEG